MKHVGFFKFSSTSLEASRAHRESTDVLDLAQQLSGSFVNKEKLVIFLLLVLKSFCQSCIPDIQGPS